MRAATTQGTKKLIKIPDDLLRVLNTRAKKKMRSLNSEIIVLAKIGLARAAEEDKALDDAEKIIRQSDSNVFELIGSISKDIEKNVGELSDDEAMKLALEAQAWARGQK